MSEPAVITLVAVLVTATAAITVKVVINLKNKNKGNKVTQKNINAKIVSERDTNIKK